MCIYVDLLSGRLLWLRHCAKYFIYITSYNPLNNFTGQVSSPLLIGSNWCLKKLQIIPPDCYVIIHLANSLLLKIHILKKLWLPKAQSKNNCAQNSLNKKWTKAVTYYSFTSTWVNDHISTFFFTSFVLNNIAALTLHCAINTLSYLAPTTL